MTTTVATAPSPAASAALRAAAWLVLVGVAAGSLAGLLVGGVGGRLAMLLLRLTSPETVIGLTSDDGFEMGVVSLDTLELVGVMAILGAVNGLLYAAVRTAIAPRLRLVLWAGFAALVGGAGFVHEDGVDFTVVEPALLAIVFFVALPGVAAALVVVLVERLSARPPGSGRRHIALLVVVALAGNVLLALGGEGVQAAALALAAVLAGGALVGAMVFVLLVPAAGRIVRGTGRVVVPVVLVGAGILAGVGLVQTSAAILG